MHQLIKYELNFHESLEYVKDNLEDVNALSVALLESLEFKSGHFFTLLPPGSNHEAKHNFLAGGILPQNPIEKYCIDGRQARYSIKATLRDEISNLILNEMNLNARLSGVFDDVSGTTPNHNTHPCFADNYTAFHDDEVYYILNKKNVSYELIWDILKASTSFWHSLGVITKLDLNDFTKSLTLGKIKKICLETELVIVGAYDAEGYIFWEKAPKLGHKGYFE